MRLGWTSIEGHIFLSKHNFIPRIFSLCYGKLGLFTKEEFLSEPRIGFLSSSKYKFRDQFWDFWFSKTPEKSNPNLTPDQENPKLLKLVVLVHSLYLDIGEGSGVKMFTKGTSRFYPHPVNILVPENSSFLIYSECTKTTSFSILGFFQAQGQTRVWISWSFTQSKNSTLVAKIWFWWGEKSYVGLTKKFLIRGKP